jgi:hypothetical protein
MGVRGVILIPLVASACLIEITGVDEPRKREATEAFVRSVPILGQTAARVEGLNGTIRITGLSGLDAVSVQATKRVRSRSFRDAEWHLDDLEVRVWTLSTEIRIETIQPLHDADREYIVDYEILVPDDLDLVVVNGNGDLVIEDLRAQVDLKVGNGNVRTRGFVGTGLVEVGNGSLDVAMVLPEGGEIVLLDGNGTVTLALQPDVSAELEAQVGNGTISVSGFDMTNHVSAPHLVRSTLGDGDGRIVVSVGNGTIRIEPGPFLTARAETTPWTRARAGAYVVVHAPEAPGAPATPLGRHGSSGPAQTLTG